MLLIYLLRDIQAEFSMNHELVILTFIQVLVDFVINYILIVIPQSDISSSNNLQYIMAVRGIVLLYFSAI